MKTVSNGYIMGFLCGYMKGGINPGVFGYHRGYTQKVASEGPGPEAAQKTEQPCKCGKPGCTCKVQKPQKAV